MTLSGSLVSAPQLAYGVFTAPLMITSQRVSINTSGQFALGQGLDLKAIELKSKADAIDSYFAERNMPLEGTGMKMVLEAEAHDIDWRLLPAIAVRESTGGKFACKKASYSPFGWGSCKINFKSYDEAIEIVAKNLGGNNPKTAHHYDEKTTAQILRAYNPPSIVPRYAEQVISIMNAIGPMDVIETLAVANG
jgi:hypothetical protein